MVNNGYTNVDNRILMDGNLSDTEFRIYCILVNKSNCPNYKITRAGIGDIWNALKGTTTLSGFSKAWKDLQKLGYLVKYNETTGRDRFNCDWKVCTYEEVNGGDSDNGNKGNGNSSGGNSDYENTDNTNSVSGSTVNNTVNTSASPMSDIPQTVKDTVRADVGFATNGEPTSYIREDNKDNRLYKTNQDCQNQSQTDANEVKSVFECYQVGELTKPVKIKGTVIPSQEIKTKFCEALNFATDLTNFFNLVADKVNKFQGRIWSKTSYIAATIFNSITELSHSKTMLNSNLVTNSATNNSNGYKFNNSSNYNPNYAHRGAKKYKYTTTKFHNFEQRDTDYESLLQDIRESESVTSSHTPISDTKQCETSKTYKTEFKSLNEPNKGLTEPFGETSNSVVEPVQEQPVKEDSMSFFSVLKDLKNKRVNEYQKQAEDTTFPEQPEYVEEVRQDDSTNEVHTSELNSVSETVSTVEPTGTTESNYVNDLGETIIDGVNIDQCAKKVTISTTILNRIKNKLHLSEMDRFMLGVSVGFSENPVMA